MGRKARIRRRLVRRAPNCHIGRDLSFMEGTIDLCRPLNTEISILFEEKNRLTPQAM